MPNISGNIGTIGLKGTIDGAFQNIGSAGDIRNTDGEPDYQVDFNAFRCSTVYGNSDTVQPAAGVVIYLIKY